MPIFTKIDSVTVLIIALLCNIFVGLLLQLDEGPVRVTVTEQRCPEYVCEGMFSPKLRVKEQVKSPIRSPTALKGVTDQKNSTDLAILEDSLPVSGPPANASLADSPTSVTYTPSKLARGIVVHGWILELFVLFFADRNDVVAYVGALGVSVLGVQFVLEAWETYTPLYLMILASIVPFLYFIPLEYQRQADEERESAVRKAIRNERLRETATRRASSRAVNTPSSGPGSVLSDS